MVNMFAGGSRVVTVGLLLLWPADSTTGFRLSTKHSRGTGHPRMSCHPPRHCIVPATSSARSIISDVTRNQRIFAIQGYNQKVAYFISGFRFHYGVYLNHDLKWSRHIDHVTAKAARKLGFVRRNLRGSPADCKKLAYISLVRSGMEYASIIWDPYTKADSTN